MYFSLTLKHIGCWSNLLSKYNKIYGELISQRIIDKKYIEANIIFQCVDKTLLKNKNNKTDYFNNFFNNLGKQSDIIGFEKLESMSGGSVYLIKIHARIKNSISEIINSYNPPYFREIFYHGFETWHIFSWSDEVNKIIENVKKRGEIIEYAPLEYTEFETVITKLDASKNIELLNEIYNSGYYSIKKNSNLRELANHYNVSKSGLSRKLRRIEINAIRYYLKTHIPANSLDKFIEDYTEDDIH